MLTGTATGAKVEVAGAPQGISLNNDFTVKVRPKESKGACAHLPGEGG